MARELHFQGSPAIRLALRLSQDLILEVIQMGLVILRGSNP